MAQPITLSKKDKAYIDISLAFVPDPINDDITLLTNARAINNALRNLIMIVPTEVPFQRNVGSHVSSYLFDSVDQGTASLLRIEIERAVMYGEPRIELQDVVVEAQPDQNQFACNITYKIVGSEQIFTIQQILIPTR